MICTNTPTFCLSSVSPEAYDEVVAVWEASVRATHHFVTEAEILFYRPMLRQEYLWLVTLTCARDSHGKMLGFAGVAADKLEMLFLHPSARGKGIGKRLLQHAVQQLKITKVDVNEENEQAVGFYLHEGFTVINRSEVDNLGMPHPILHLELVKKT
ncbi:GNAT family N-acetyltransferase [Rufibacter sediminis]|uniref:GNAT family N-acetyltransferase n=1 Tax=Rufibacter sediminis TaxID=2762756 RepID=A0ABR6VT83_9BACT|nr:GNAT family N-acetyltransferase [Rufibacter sediminis]MBC3540379.1 GNAT family N-acetyltransferase [Rufibacter sediminis]